MARWMTIDQKRQIIAKSVECPSLTHAELAEWAVITFKLPHKPARSTISGILSNTSRITIDAYGDGRRRKPLKVLSLRLEHRLVQWVKEYKDKNIYLSRQLITMRARHLQGEICDTWDLNLAHSLHASPRFAFAPASWRSRFCGTKGGSSRTAEPTRDNGSVRKLPTNTTAYLQPMGSGIIAAFKQRYRRKQLEWVYGKMKRREDVDKKAYAVDQRRAMEWSNEIWQDMQKTRTISNGFRHTGVDFNGVNENPCTYGDDFYRWMTDCPAARSLQLTTSTV
ncbi:hypothetical protein PR001_g2741 [Phytophthora rubi]|uniref:DDE-1 domain-containing protein n=2 Tax=Phytophthora rubi TaxID=129364 RepID=A0A6A3PBK4_9STRA|nr:hypothetical protein PR001_g2741 [Phytophthora rubi]